MEIKSTISEKKMQQKLSETAVYTMYTLDNSCGANIIY